MERAGVQCYVLHNHSSTLNLQSMISILVFLRFFEAYCRISLWILLAACAALRTPYRNHKEHSRLRKETKIMVDVWAIVAPTHD